MQVSPQPVLPLSLVSLIRYFVLVAFESHELSLDS